MSAKPRQTAAKASSQRSTRAAPKAGSRRTRRGAANARPGETPASLEDASVVPPAERGDEMPAPGDFEVLPSPRRPLADFEEADSAPYFAFDEAPPAQPETEPEPAPPAEAGPAPYGARMPQFLADIERGDARRCARLSEAAVDVRGIASNSSSPSDTWIVVFYDRADRALVPAFMKIFIIAEREEDTSAESLGMLYEALVYSRVIRPLIDAGVCPHFVQNYDASTEGCTFDDLAALLSKSRVFAAGGAGAPDLEAASAALRRNALIVLSSIVAPNRTPKRPAVTAPRPALPDGVRRRFARVDVRALRFGYIMNESVGGARDIHDWARENAHDPAALLIAAFQVVVACQAMALSLLAHNDLHLGNIYMVDLGAPRDFEYRVDGARGRGAATYVFTSRYSPRLYDFDLSYARRLGPNPYLETEFEWLCARSNKCNEFVRNKDALKFGMNYFRRVAALAGVEFEERFATERAALRYARAFPQDELPAFARELAAAFATRSGEPPARARANTARLTTAYIRGNFLEAVAMYRDEYRDPFFEIGYKDLPSNLEILENLAGMIAAAGGGAPRAGGPRVVAACTRERFDARTGELVA